VRQTDSQGFTLIEVLVAFTIAVILLVPLLHSFSTGLGSISRTDCYTDATVIARSAFEALAPSADGGSTRQVESYQVSTRVHSHATEGSAMTVVPYDVLVTVAWQDGTHRRSVALHGIQLGPAPAAEAAP
jgi:prepilin-type N-terminal cleavage/methylation domain-containing protein